MSKTLADELAELRAALLELRATVLACLNPRTLGWLFVIGFVAVLGVWFVTELVRSFT